MKDSRRIPRGRGIAGGETNLPRGNNVKKILLAAMIIFACTFLICGDAISKMKGACVSCHTMHNSENGKPVALNGMVSWGSGPLNGTDASSTPFPESTIADCIGCHSNSAGETIVAEMGLRVPIVNNFVPPTQKALAGGNFYWVRADNTNGHHVLQANALGVNYAPGLEGNTGFLDQYRSGNCTKSCHVTLYQPVGNTTLTGCQGCHFYQFHHRPFGPYNPANPLEVDATYRFLSGHNYTTGNYVLGIESYDWQQDATSTAHNVYMSNGTVPSGMINAVNHGISSFCAACHGTFHLDQGGGGIWLRHPVDVLAASLIADGHESLLYNGAGGPGVYDPAVPLAYDDITVTRRLGPGEEVPGEYQSVTALAGKVMCLSCHVAHGSPYKYMLKFDYQAMIAGNGTVSGGAGCFGCHTDKNLK